MRTFDIIGNNISAMIAGLELAKKGNTVRLVNSLPFWGSHLVGTVIEEEKFDFGRIIYDFFSYNNDDTSSLLTYDPHVRNDVGRFYSLIRKYIESYLEVNEMEMPSMYYKGKYTEDFLFADSLRILKELDEDKREIIKAELEAICADKGELHASNKKHPTAAFMEADCAEVSIANHGKTLHEMLIVPYLKKVLSSDNPSLSALYHRIPWIPLYYPETLLSHFTNAPQQLPVPKFHYPVSGHFSIIIEKLKADIESQDNITVYSEKLLEVGPNIEGKRIIKLENNELESEQLIWAGDQEQLAKSLGVAVTVSGETQKLPITFTFLSVETEKIKRKFSVLTVVDSELIPYRITNQTICAGRDDKRTKLVVECNPDQLVQRASEDINLQKQEIVDTLIKMGIIESRTGIENISIKRVDKTIRIPSRSNEEIFNEYDKSLISQHNDIIKLGTSLDFVSISINDQIIQGLYTAERYG